MGTSTIGSLLPLFGFLLAIGCFEQRLEPCDVRQTDCQQDVFLTLQMLRGDGWNVFTEMPPVETITWEQFRDMLLSSVSDEEQPPDPWDAALRLLSLIPPESSAAEASAEVLISDVIAYYSYATRSVTVIDRTDLPDSEEEEPRDRAYETEILAHEFVHAIQDREIGRPNPYATVDEAFSRDAHVEGEAVLYEILLGLYMADVSPQRVDWDGFYDKILGDVRRAVVESSAPFYTAQELVYPLGAEHLTRRYLQGGNAALRTAYADRLSTGAAYMENADSDWQREAPPVDCLFSEPEGLELYGITAMGAPVAYAFLTAAGAEDAEAWDASLAWQDDLILVYADESGESVAFLWCLRFRDETSAEGFIGHLSPDDYRLIARQGDQVAIAAATDDPGLADWDPGL